MTIKEVLTKYYKAEIDLLLAFVLKKSREFLFMNPGYKLTVKQLSNLTKLIERRKKGEPMAYILGYKDFCGLRFKVNKDVLIPRPETEWIIDRIKNYELGIKNKSIKILDMGTGSACIAVSLAKKLQAASCKLNIYASDISKKALRVAKENAIRHKVKIKFIKSNLFNQIKDKFDIIIANLPYVLLRDYKLRIEDLRYEPKQALTDNTNEWKIYQKFFEQLSCHIRQDSTVLLEIDPKVKRYLSLWAKKYLRRNQTKSVLLGFPQERVKFYRDLNNLWRYMEISSSTLPKTPPRSTAYRNG